MWRVFQKEETAGSTVDMDDKRCLRCSACDHMLAENAKTAAIDGRANHVCTNPAGFTHSIRCYRHLEGATLVGAPSSEWSWFPPATWQIAQCGRCSAHIGWMFVGREQPFWGCVVQSVYED